ncbi:MAG: hypothetical protein ACT4NU_10495 [Chromatiales bacterium]
MVEAPDREPSVFEALDRLVEVDVDEMERMSELRLTSASLGATIAQLSKETELIAELAPPGFSGDGIAVPPGGLVKNYTNTAGRIYGDFSEAKLIRTSKCSLTRINLPAQTLTNSNSRR